MEANWTYGLSPGNATIYFSKLLICNGQNHVKVWVYYGESGDGIWSHNKYSNNFPGLTKYR